MIAIRENVDLKPYNTFGIQASTKYFAVVRTLGELQELINSQVFKNNDRLIVGGGSNLLFTRDFDGLVIKNEIVGIEEVEQNDRTITLQVGAGENWHTFVMYCVQRNYGGIENLSLIPGTVGAAPMQNIGAYGVEIKEVIRTVEAVALSDGKVRIFSNEECRFGYRESVFKQELKDKYFISSITLTLTKKDHRLNTSYGAIHEVLNQKNVKSPSIKAISDAVIEIRRKKLPDPILIGNAGSFFKNPSIGREEFERLKEKFSGIPSFPGENNLVKIPAAWLIEQNGWKGKTLENIGVHKDQALVLVNYGGGDGRKIWQLALDIQESVVEKFGIRLTPEVNVI
jgi:UDP-N-acetylmuramate dehydrogenase